MWHLPSAFGYTNVESDDRADGEAPRHARKVELWRDICERHLTNAVNRCCESLVQRRAGDVWESEGSQVRMGRDVRVDSGESRPSWRGEAVWVVMKEARTAWPERDTAFAYVSVWRPCRRDAERANIRRIWAGQRLSPSSSTALCLAHPFHGLLHAFSPFSHRIPRSPPPHTRQATSLHALRSSRLRTPRPAYDNRLASNSAHLVTTMSSQNPVRPCTALVAAASSPPCSRFVASSS